MLFLVNIRVRLWSLPVIAVGLLALVSVLLGTAYPAFVQQFSVKPQEQQRETPYIAYNIAGTRRAFDLDTIAVSERPADPNVTVARAGREQPTVSNIRLWRPSVLKENFQSLQRIRQYYEFQDVDVDRYTVIGRAARADGVGSRDERRTGSPRAADLAEHAPGLHARLRRGRRAGKHRARPRARRCFTLSDIPPVGEPTIEEPRIYFGELNDVPFVVTNTHTKELDYEGASQEQDTTYTGTGGIPIGNVFQRALFAWRFKDINLLISGLIDSNSRIMIYRDLARARPQACAVPEVRRRPVPRGRGRQADVDLRRLHHDDRVSVFTVGEPR